MVVVVGIAVEGEVSIVVGGGEGLVAVVVGGLEFVLVGSSYGRWISNVG